MRQISLLLTLLAVVGVAVSLGFAATADAKSPKTTTYRGPAFTVHDFGVTIFPAEQENSQATCALQTPNFVIKAYRSQGEYLTVTEEIWGRMLAGPGDAADTDAADTDVAGNDTSVEEASEVEDETAADTSESSEEEVGEEATEDVAESENETAEETSESSEEEEGDSRNLQDRTNAEAEYDNEEEVEETEEISEERRTRRRVVVVDPFLAFYPVDPSKWPSRGAKVTVDISFPGGEPFYWYPEATAGDSLVWKNLNLTVKRPKNKRLPKAGKIAQGKKYVPHWYETPRAAGSLFASTGRTLEKFLFYGGLMIQAPAVEIEKKDGKFYLTSFSGRTLRDVVVISKKRNVIYYAHVNSLAPGVVDMPVKMVKIGFSAAEFADEEASRWGLRLKKAGLFEEEVKTVVGMMRRDLLESDGTRAIYLASDKVYDEMCSIKISPAPVARIRTSLCAVMLED